MEFTEEIDRDSLTSHLVLSGLPPDLATAILATSSAANYLAAAWMEFYNDPSVLEASKVIKPDGTIQYPHDLAAQNLIVKTLRTRNRNDGILAEENLAKNIRAQRVWLVDGLDGTKGFGKAENWFATATGLVKNGVLQNGVIQHPLPMGWRDIVFAQRGIGAYFYSTPGPLQRLHVSECSSVQNARFVTHRWIIDTLKHHHLVSQSESLGSAALQQGYVAMGLKDGYFSKTLNPWDAIGSIIIEEAGGKVTDWRGKPRDPFSHDSIVATNGHIHDELVQMLEPLLDSM